MKKFIIILLMLIIMPVYALETDATDRTYIEKNKVYTSETTKQKIRELGEKIKNINTLDKNGRVALKKEMTDIRAEVKAGVDAKKQEAASFKDELNSLKATINSNHQNIVSLISVNKGIRNDIKLEIKKLKDNKTTIDSKIIDQIKTKTTEIKNYGDLFKDTKNKLTTEVNIIKVEASRYNYTEIKNRYNTIITIQAERVKKINEVNAKLLEIKTLLNI